MASSTSEGRGSSNLFHLSAPSDLSFSPFEAEFPKQPQPPHPISKPTSTAHVETGTISDINLDDRDQEKVVHEWKPTKKELFIMMSLSFISLMVALDTAILVTVLPVCNALYESHLYQTHSHCLTGNRPETKRHRDSNLLGRNVLPIDFSYRSASHRSPFYVVRTTTTSFSLYSLLHRGHASLCECSKHGYAHRWPLYPRSRRWRCCHAYPDRILRLDPSTASTKVLLHCVSRMGNRHDYWSSHWWCAYRSCYLAMVLPYQLPILWPQLHRSILGCSSGPGCQSDT